MTVPYGGPTDKHEFESLCPLLLCVQMGPDGSALPDAQDILHQASLHVDCVGQAETLLALLGLLLKLLQAVQEGHHRASS
jgi:hypothetical protein